MVTSYFFLGILPKKTYKSIIRLKEIHLKLVLIKYFIIFIVNLKKKQHTVKALLFFLVFMVLYNAQGQTTQLAASFCPGTLSNIGSNITCTANLGQGHRFEVRKMNNTLVGVYDGVAANLIYPSRSKYMDVRMWN